MSLLSTVVTIATAGAAGGETFWGSSVRITTSLTSGQAVDRIFNNAAEFGSGGNIVQAISSNALASAEGDGRGYDGLLRDVCAWWPASKTAALLGTISKLLQENKALVTC